MVTNCLNTHGCKVYDYKVWDHEINSEKSIMPLGALVKARCSLLYGIQWGSILSQPMNCIGFSPEVTFLALLTDCIDAIFLKGGLASAQKECPRLGSKKSTERWHTKGIKVGRGHNFARLDLGQGPFLRRHAFLGFFRCTFNDTKKNISSLWKMESLQVIRFPFGMKSAKETMFTRGPRIFPQLKRTAQKDNMVFPSL